MATESIFHNIVIDDAKKAEIFINALEQAAKVSEHSSQPAIQTTDLTKEDLKKFIWAE